MRLRTLFILLSFFPVLCFGDTVSHINPNLLQSKIESIINNESPSDVLIVWNTDMFLSGKNNPHFDKNIKKLIQQLQKKDIKMIGFTSTLTKTKSASQKRYIFEYRDMLQKQGLDFSRSYPRNFIGPVMTFFDFPRKHNQYYPMFYHGILSFNGKQEPIFKANVLKAFLFAASSIFEDKLGRKGYYPKIIIWVNDLNEDLIQAQQTLQALNKDLIFSGLLVGTKDNT